MSRLAPVLAREGLPLPSKLRSRRWTKLKSLPAGQSAPLRKSCIFTDPRSSLTNEVLFAGGDHGLWVTDGTAQGTHEVNAIKNAYPGSLSPSNFVVFDGKALFEGVDAQNHESLWVTDGTASGTHELVGIKNANPNGLDPQEMTVLNGEVLFRGSTRTIRLIYGSRTEQRKVRMNSLASPMLMLVPVE